MPLASTTKPPSLVVRHFARSPLPHPTQLLILTYLSVRARRSAAAAAKAAEDAAAVGAKPAESSPAAEAGAEGAEGNGDKKLVDEEAEEEDGGHHTLAGETEAQRVLRRHVFMHDAVSGCWWCQPPCFGWCTLGFTAFIYTRRQAACGFHCSIPSCAADQLPCSDRLSSLPSLGSSLHVSPAPSRRSPTGWQLWATFACWRWRWALCPPSTSRPSGEQPTARHAPVLLLFWRQSICHAWCAAWQADSPAHTRTR